MTSRKYGLGSVTSSMYFFILSSHQAVEVIGKAEKDVPQMA